MPSVTDYAIAASDRISVFHYTRQSARQWTMTEYTELTDTLTFGTLDVTISLSDIYRNIVFPAAQEDDFK